MAPMSAHARFIGRPTRGKTALNRLRQVDAYVAIAEPGALRGGSPLVVDLGYGARPWTTLEMADRWWRVNPRLRFLGIEIDAERVAAAQPFAQEGRLSFALGGFDVAQTTGRGAARLVRCYNVLRQYDEHEVELALERIRPAIEEGGWLVEGTCDPLGRMTAFDVYRHRAGRLEHRALVFGTNFRSALEPADFRAILPKRMIHRMLEEPQARFFADWSNAWMIARGQGLRSERAVWATAARELRERFCHLVDTRPRILRRGYLVVRDDLR